MDKYIETQRFLRDIPGLLVSAGTLGKEEFILASGYSDHVSKIPMKEGDAFHVASISKTLLATAYFKMLEEREETLTEEDMRLLTHTSSLRDEGPALWKPEENRFCYCDKGYELLAGKLEKMTGMSYEEYVQEKIFSPAGMTGSSFDLREGMAMGHKKDESRHIVHETEMEEKKPGAILITDIYDLTRYMKAQMEKSLLTEASYEKMWKHRVMVPDTKDQMTCGWFETVIGGEAYLGHEGGTLGYRASMYLSPETGKYAAVCANLTGAATRPVLEGILKRI